LWHHLFLQQAKRTFIALVGFEASFSLLLLHVCVRDPPTSSDPPSDKTMRENKVHWGPCADGTPASMRAPPERTASLRLLASHAGAALVKGEVFALCTILLRWGRK
jgi:hypothetical protein